MGNIITRITRRMNKSQGADKDTAKSDYKNDTPEWIISTLNKNRQKIDSILAGKHTDQAAIIIAALITADAMLKASHYKHEGGRHSGRFPQHRNVIER